MYRSMKLAQNLYNKCMKMGFNIGPVYQIELVGKIYHLNSIFLFKLLFVLAVLRKNWGKVIF